jgi:hypothetical protein
MVSERFAWLPVQVTSGKWTWLRRYYQHKSLYDETTGRPPINSLHFTWTETASERTWRVLKESVVHNRNVWNAPDLTNQDTI